MLLISRSCRFARINQPKSPPTQMDYTFGQRLIGWLAFNPRPSRKQLEGSDRVSCYHAEILECRDRDASAQRFDPGRIIALVPVCNNETQRAFAEA
jgi:hypothetical protein